MTLVNTDFWVRWWPRRCFCETQRRDFRVIKKSGSSKDEEKQFGNLQRVPGRWSAGKQSGAAQKEPTWAPLLLLGSLGLGREADDSSKR